MKRKAISQLAFGVFFMTGCVPSLQNMNTTLKNSREMNSVYEDIKKIPISETDNSMFHINSIKKKYKNIIPTQWGEKIDGVITGIETKDKVIALTFDACGGKTGNGYNSRLISYLIKENVPATLFVNSRWIDSNLDTFLELARYPLFEIENHGTLHKPLSVNGRSAYNIVGTRGIDEVINEVYINEQKIQRLTGRKPKYFRSGTAYYDDVSVLIVKELGEKPIGFNILGDAGATFSAGKIVKASLSAKEGSIIIYHMNHPEKETAEGIIKSIPILREKGFKFVKLEDYDLLLSGNKQLYNINTPYR